MDILNCVNIQAIIKYSFTFNICTHFFFMSHNTFSPLVVVLFQSLPIIFASCNIILGQILDDLKLPCTSRTYHYTHRLQYLPTLIRETYIYIRWWSTQDLQLVKVKRIRDCTRLSSKCNIIHHILLRTAGNGGEREHSKTARATANEWLQENSVFWTNSWIYVLTIVVTECKQTVQAQARQYPSTEKELVTEFMDNQEAIGNC